MYHWFGSQLVILLNSFFIKKKLTNPFLEITMVTVKKNRTVIFKNQECLDKKTIFQFFFNIT